jgi:RsiW-degrading membrane proteinase PrsW (M82 family)
MSQKIVLIVVSAIGLAFLIFMICIFRNGFDFTDEAVFYTIMERPWDYPSSHLISAFIFSPVYLMLEGDIPKLRIGVFLIFFSLPSISSD